MGERSRARISLTYYSSQGNIMAIRYIPLLTLVACFTIKADWQQGAKAFLAAMKANNHAQQHELLKNNCTAYDKQEQLKLEKKFINSAKSIHLNDGTEEEWQKLLVNIKQTESMQDESIKELYKLYRSDGKNVPKPNEQTLSNELNKWCTHFDKNQQAELVRILSKRTAGYALSQDDQLAHDALLKASYTLTEKIWHGWYGKYVATALGFTVLGILIEWFGRRE
jgi:hypothetical protein